MIKKIFGFGMALTVLAGCNTAKEETSTKSGIDAANFTTEIDGKPVGLYTLTNANGVEACITNYGGRVVSLMVPDKNGEFKDVVLGYDSISGYRNIADNFGALIGRYGNRINQGKFTLEGVEYQLPQNDFGHCLHGGAKGFHHSVWDVDTVTGNSITLSLHSPDGEDGFPGNVDVKVVYTLTDDNALDIAYEATTDKETILNLTNHSYFNLSGDPTKDILGEVLWIDAEGYTPIDSTFMTTGEILPVAGTPFDFTTPKPLGKDIDASDVQLANGLGYDHNIVLRSSRKANEAAASVVDPETGIKMEVFTDEPGIQFYSGNFLDGTFKGKKGVAYAKRTAFCLETQHYPDSPNKPEWPSVTVKPGETYTSHCAYKFSVAEN